MRISDWSSDVCSSDLPKGVRREKPTPEQVAANTVAIGTYYGLKSGQPGVILMNGPMYHSAPNSYGLTAARQGKTIVLQARFDPAEMLELIQRYHVTNMHIVPTMFVRLLKLPEEDRKRTRLNSSH